VIVAHYFDIGQSRSTPWQRRPCANDLLAELRNPTTLSVVVPLIIVAILSYRHIYLLVRRYGETSWTAALLPISVDGMIAASSMSSLLDSRYSRRSGLLPWALLIIGSAASLAANVAVCQV
jgi:hypothetical protein